MQDTNRNIFYTPEDINRYLSGRMTAQEMHELERAALSDPLIADAIDGFRIADTKTTQKHLQEISAAILNQQSKNTSIVSIEKNRSKQGWKLLAAACVLGAIATGTWWMVKPDQKVAIETAQIKAIVNQNIDTSVLAMKPKISERKMSDSNVMKEGAISTPIIAKADKKPITNSNNNINKNPSVETIAASAPVAAAAVPVKEPVSVEAGAKKTAEIQNNEIATVATSDADIQQNQVAASKPMARVATMRAMPMQKTFMASGKVTDEKGNPLAAVSILGPDNKIATTKSDGKFSISVPDSVGSIKISMAGYNSRSWKFTSGKLNNIVLSKNTDAQNELVVVGAEGRKTQRAKMGDFNKFRKTSEAQNAKSIAYPEEGWAQFYQEIENDLGVDKSKPTKTIQIKFTLDENGEPTDFTIVESADELLIKKAIEHIKKAKWKNYKLNKNAIVKIEVN